MKEKLYTIPVNDAIAADDECMFCNIERSLEQDALEYVLGCSSYMESDMRDLTDAAGFCRLHLKKMYDYGNAQGNALMLQTHIKKLMQEMKKEFMDYKPAKAGTKEKLVNAIKKGDGELKDPISIWCQSKDISCYVCNYYKDTFLRYVDTFFYLFKNDPEFVVKLKKSKGLCLHHLGLIMEKMRFALSEEKSAELRAILFELSEKNMERLYEEISLFCNKFDYKYDAVPWGNSKDSVQRVMQKLRGGYPADAPYRNK